MSSLKYIYKNKEFETYDLDNKETIKNRISINLGNVKKYISISFNQIDDNKINIDAYNLFDLIYDTNLNAEIFYNLLNKADKDKPVSKYNLPVFDKIKPEDFASIWYKLKYTKNKNLLNFPEGNIIIKNTILNTFGSFLKDNNIVFDFLENNFNILKRKLDLEFNVLKKKNEKMLLFNKYKEVYSLKNEITNVNLEVQFSVDYDIYELFNYINLTPEVPFATIKNYYKILKSIKPSNKWSYTNERLLKDYNDKKDGLYLKVLTKKNLKSFEDIKYDDYTTVSIYFESFLEEEQRLKKEEEEKLNKEKENEEIKEIIKTQEEMEEKKKQKIKRYNKKNKDDNKKKDEKDDKNKDKKDDKNKDKKDDKNKDEKDDDNKEKELLQDYKNNHIEILYKDKKIQFSKVYMRIETSIDSEISKEELVDRIISLFPSKPNDISIEQLFIKTEFYIPNIEFHIPIFEYLILNHNIASDYFYIDDNASVNKKKGSIYLYFYVDENISDNNLVTCSITEQIVEQNSKILNKDPLLKLNSNYLKVRITKIKNLNFAEKFRNIFCRIINIYNSTKDSYIKNYENYIKNFKTILYNEREELLKKRKKVTRTKILLKDINPDQYVAGHARHGCPTKRSPEIFGEKVNDIEENKDILNKIQNLNDKDISYILFPKNKYEEPYTYKQFYYTCENNKYGYNEIGLKENKIGNVDMYPLVPCCFKKQNQTKEIWKEYIENNRDLNYFTQKKKIVKSDYTITTNKVVAEYRYATLPENINKLLFNLDPTRQFMRLGIRKSPNSVIICLLYALKNFNDYKYSDFIDNLDVNNDDDIFHLREIILSTIYGQEFYNYTNIQDFLQSYKNNQEKNIDLKLFKSLLEYVFKCNILFFSQNENNPKGFMDVSYHLHDYLYKPNKNPLLILYYHMGTELDKLSYPHCELIIAKNNNNYDYVYNEKENIYNRLYKIFNKLYINPIIENIFYKFKTKIISQYVDYYGKTRIIEFSNNIFCYTKPLIITNIKINNLDYFYNKVNIKNEVIKFLSNENIKYQYYISNNILYGIFVDQKDNKLYFPINPEINNNKENITEYPVMLYKKSLLDSYCKYDKLSRYLLEYFLYLFSLYYKNNNKQNEDLIKENFNDYLKKFVVDNIIIEENHIYKDIPRIFSLKDSGLLKDNKLILTSRLILKKLLYNLKLRFKLNKLETTNYSSYKYMQNYYSNIRDFKQLSSQPIIYGQYSLINWIKNKVVNYNLDKNIIDKGINIIDQIKKLDTKKMFMLIFLSKWNKQSKSLMDKIFIPTYNKDILKKTLTYSFKDSVNFVYIDIDNNNDLSLSMNVTSIPFGILLKIVGEEQNNIIELGRIKFGSKLFENVRLIRNLINKNID